MRIRGLVLVFAVSALVLAGCTDPGAGPGPSMENPIEPCGELDTTFEPSNEYNPRIVLETTNGTMTVVVYGQQVPFTAGHLNRLLEEGIWEDTRFHQVHPGEAILGGDPRSSNEDRNAWGTGGYHYNTIDEHHQFLRHDEEGIISFLSPQPNRVGSQFVLTLSPQPQFDDQNPVFGKVIEGMDTAHELAATPRDDRARPLYGAHLENVTWVDPPNRDTPDPELSAYGFDCTELAEPGEEAEYLIAVRNTGPSILDGTMETDAEEGWNVTLRNSERLVISSGQTVAYGLNVTVPEDAEPGTEQTINVTFTGSSEEVSTTLELTTHVGDLGEPATDQEEVQLRYVGMLEDGRPFETTESVYVEDPSLTWFKDRPTDPQPITLTPSSETLERTQPGELIRRAQLGETVVGFISPEDAYGTESYGDNDLGGRLLVFQVQVIQSA